MFQAGGVTISCAAAKASFPANYYTLCRRFRYNILQRTSGNKDVYLLSPYSQSSCPYHEQN